MRRSARLCAALQSARFCFPSSILRVVECRAKFKFSWEGFPANFRDFAVACGGPHSYCVHVQTPHPPQRGQDFFLEAHVACPRARTAASKHRCIVDARPSLARRRRPGRFAGRYSRPRRRAQHTRTDYVPCVAHPHTQDTTHRPQTATGARHPGRAAWALRLPGRWRGRRAMTTSTSTTERHNQPARRSPCAGPDRPPATAARPTATRQRPPHPSRTGVQRGVSSRCDPQRARGDLDRSPQISAGGDPKRRLFTFAFPETLRAPLPKPLAVVKWYRIDA